MINVFLVIQIIISMFLIGVILLQKDSNDSLSGLSGSMGGIASAKTASTILVKITKYLACAFIINSLILGNLATRIGKSHSLIEKIDHQNSEDIKSVPVGE